MPLAVISVQPASDWRRLAIDETCRPARINLELLVNRLGTVQQHLKDAEVSPARTEPRPLTTTESPATVKAGVAQPEPRPSVIIGTITEPMSVSEEAPQPLRVVREDSDGPPDGVIGRATTPLSARR